MADLWFILGASSAMARAFGRHLADEGAAIVLLGRDMEDLKRSAEDLHLRGAESVEILAFDLRDSSSFGPALARAAAFDGTVSAAVFAGSMPPQEKVQEEPELFAPMVIDNFTGAAEFLLRLAPEQERRGKGEVVGVSSVAGDRGRFSNYAYGSAKAGFQTFLSGHRNRMARSGIHVMTVKPGFVDTAMTWGLPGLFLVASPADVAQDIASGLRKKRNVIYTPWFWMGIMTIIRTVPERIFKKLSF
ncbi:SDR family NAD(P)-dependent oxidoreductase [Algicella marina]|uniref:SDR family NAD(P)-dependent oxidoreductase n=1 Tax=Algicella marina TaxID=2683284 RepID=A0A6P1SW03_9RHOB|nr:SDR family NAD(P)-dependent oxidoreductase [Algicella marina]QHQ33671.1 SDR family NAD(P)-dependent oxidoreductase [Algicella marina]